MNIECSVEKLKRAAQTGERMTGKNLTLPILSSLLLVASGKSLKVRATNLSLGIEVEIPAKVTTEGVLAVRGDTLSQFLSSLDGNQMITLKEVGDTLSLATKESRATIKTFPYEDFPTIPVVDGESFKLPLEKFVSAVKAVSYSGSTSDIKPEIASVYLYTDSSDLVAVATDSFRLAEKRVRISNVPDISGIIVPNKNINEIIRSLDGMSGELSVVFTKNQISFSFDDTYITSRLIDGVFPDYKQIIPKTKTTSVVVLRSELQGALKAATVFTDKFNQITFTVDVARKHFSINAKNTDIGEHTTDIPAALSGEDVTVSLNERYVIDCFQSITADSISIDFLGNSKPVIFKGISDQTFTYLAMPMNR